jgi:hypothetical protein
MKKKIKKSKVDVNKKYYRFTEENDWEGETYNFYLNLTDKQLSQLQNILYKMGEDMPYLLDVTPIDEKEVNTLCKNSYGGYMAFENKVENPKIPNKVKSGDDPFYKGGQWEK